MACELRSWKNYWSLSYLAAAYAELGEFDEAVEMQREAIDWPRMRTKKKKHQRRLELYQAGKPYREKPVRK